MSKLPLRAFIPYTVPLAAFDKLSSLGAHEVDDPKGASWRTVGMVPPLKGEAHTVDLQGGATLAAIRFNERILPSKVRDEHVAKKVKALAEQEGRNVSKKEYAQIRDDVELELLPKAFIRRTVVPLIFFRTKFGINTEAVMLICTSSQKKADDITAMLRLWISDLSPLKMDTVRAPLGVLTTLAKHGGEYYEDDAHIEPLKFAVLKGKEKRTIRIKDKDIGDSDIETLLRQDYEVHELGLGWSPTGTIDDDDGVEFVVNTNLTFKGIVLPGVKREKEDEFEYLVLFASTMKQFLPSFIAGSLEGLNDDDEL